jgi:hypothetical protein
MRDVAAVFLLAAIISAPRAEAQSPDPALLKRLQAIAAFVTDGHAKYEAPSIIKRGQAGTPLAGHVVALFSLSGWGGGNGSRQFLAVLERHDTEVRVPEGRGSQSYSLLALVQTGHDFDRFFQEMQLSGDRITLTGGLWAKKDAHCCPSLIATATYRFSSHGLNEVNRPVTGDQP